MLMTILLLFRQSYKASLSTKIADWLRQLKPSILPLIPLHFSISLSSFSSCLPFSHLCHFISPSLVMTQTCMNPRLRSQSMICDETMTLEKRLLIHVGQSLSVSFRFLQHFFCKEFFVGKSFGSEVMIDSENSVLHFFSFYLSTGSSPYSFTHA